LKTVRVKHSNTVSFEAAFVVALAVALAVSVWWVLSDRDPTRKEMTFAYRKYLVAISSDGNLKAETEIRPHLHAIELTKKRCERLGDKRYRCEASVMMDGHPLDGHPASGNALYTHDSKGWRFEAIDKE
jgi:hypothetical protein